jgi:pimeloyl-ACP methyl ester carboxylesterase
VATVELRHVALARSGDKGAHANVGVWVQDPQLYAVLQRELTADRVAAHFAALAPSAVQRYELANILGFNFVLRDVLGAGGAAGSLRTDAQAKTYSQAILRMVVEVPDELLATRSAPPVRAARRERFEVDVSSVAPAGARTVVGDVFVDPSAAPIGPHPILLCCVPGGGMSRRYFDLDVDPAHGNYSMARHLAAKGFLVAIVDHLGVGESSRPDDGYALTPERVADVNAFVVDELVRRLRAGDIDGVAPVAAGLRTIGVGHSAGAVVTVHQQARHGTHAALAVLGFGGRGLPEHLTEAETAVAGDPVAIRAQLPALVAARFGDPLPMPKRGSSTMLVGSSLPREVHAGLVAARTNMLALVGLSSMLPGSMAPGIGEIDIPVFVGVGSRDITGPPHEIPAAFTSSRDVTLFVLDGAGHNHNVHPHRELLWDRLARWATFAP